MGLGKSLSAISLIMSTVDACRTRRTGSDPDGQPLGGTLLVAPVSSKLVLLGQNDASNTFESIERLDQTNGRVEPLKHLVLRAKV